MRCGKTMSRPPFSTATLSGSLYALSGSRRLHVFPAKLCGRCCELKVTSQDGSVLA
jgi:hypothetical protein